MSKILNPHYSEPWADNGLIQYAGYFSSEINQEISIVTELRTIYFCHIYAKPNVGLSEPPPYGLHQMPLGWRQETLTADGCIKIDTIVPTDHTMFYFVTGTKEKVDVPHAEAQAIELVGYTGEKRAFMGQIDFVLAVNGLSVTELFNNTAASITPTKPGVGSYLLTFSDTIIKANKWRMVHSFEDPLVGPAHAYMAVAARTSDTTITIMCWDPVAPVGCDFFGPLHCSLLILPS